MSFEVRHVSKAELGQLRPPSDADIQRNSDRHSWDKARVQNYQQLMSELTRHARQFAQMQRDPAQQKTHAHPPRAKQAPEKRQPDRPAPSSTPRHQPVTQAGYVQARGRTITEPRMHTPSISHLPTNVQTAMLRNQQRDARRQALSQSMQRLTDRSKGAMRAMANTVRGRPPIPEPDRAQRAGLQQLQAKNATQQRVERQADKVPDIFQKYVGKTASRENEQQRGKEQQRGRDRTR